jgi:CHAT domain-containing protein/tetratricopeptide (TPR) repeat protein
MIKYFVFLLLGILSRNSLLSQLPGSECEAASSNAFKLYSEKNFAAALPFFEKALKTCSKDSTVSDHDYYILLAATSIAYSEVGNEDSVILTGEPAAKYFEKIKAFDDPLYNTMLGRLAYAYEYIGEYENAITTFEKCIPFFKKRLGIAHNTTLEYGLELAVCYSLNESFDKAFRLNYSLKKLILDSAGRNSKVYIGVITNMGNDFLRTSVYDSALIYHKESLQLREKLMGKADPEYAKGLALLAKVYDEQGIYGDAIIYYEQSKNVYQDAGMARSGDMGTVLNDLAMCYKNLGDHTRAMDCISQSLKIKRALHGNFHVEVAAGVNNVGLILEESFDYVKALEAYRYSKYILERLRVTGNLQYAGVTANLGNCFTNIGKYDSALYFLQQALVLKEKILGNDHISVAVSLNNIAALYTDLKKYSEAGAAYTKAISVIQKIYGKKAFQLTSVFGNMALMYKERGDMQKADSLLKESYGIYSSFILNNTEGLSEKDKEGFAEGIRLNQYTALSLRKDNSLKNDWIFNSSLFYKGLLLEGSKGFTAALKNISDPVIRQKASDYLGLKKFIGAQLLKPAAGRPGDLQQIMSRAATLERELLQASSAFRNWKDQFATEWTGVQKKLKAGEMAIEFLAYYPVNIKTPDSTLYAAMIITPGSKDPVLVPLFYEVQFNRLLSKGASTESVVKKLYRSTIKSASPQPTASDSLYHLVWEPLLSELNGTTTIYFSADGVINNLNLAAIITPGGKRLVETYEFVQLSSTRNIVNTAAPPTFREMQLWGGIQYNDNASTSSTRSSTFTYLPGTLTEVNDIAYSANKNGRNIKVMVAAEASEAAFKRLDGRSPEVLHIATHGFFFPDASKISNASDNRFAKAANPLLRSGLVLANANNNWIENLVSSGKEDGILTAYEIADMDLSNTKLVVLSACETGLGDIKSGEGVYGLQRAFKLAGVNYVVMSLWQVPDLETKEFMQTFYANCFAGMPVRKAFRETQLVMNKKYQPYQWAAFVLVE